MLLLQQQQKRERLVKEGEQEIRTLNNYGKKKERESPFPAKLHGTHLELRIQTNQPTTSSSSSELWIATYQADSSQLTRRRRYWKVPSLLCLLFKHTIWSERNAIDTIRLVYRSESNLGSIVKHWAYYGSFFSSKLTAQYKCIIYIVKYDIAL